MKTIRLFSIIFSTFAILLTSCNDFLSIKPKGKLIPETVSEYEEMLNGTDVIEGSESYPGYMTDDAFLPDSANKITGTTGLNRKSKALRNLYTFKPEIFSSSEEDGLWFKAYHRLYYYNTIASNIADATEGTQQEKESIRAEALTGRAFEYLTLVNAYSVHYDPKTAATDAGVPIILEADIWKKNLTRASVESVYNQILKDLTEAEKALPEKPHLSTFRASKPAAWGLLARAYLYMGNYSEALRYSNMVLKKTSTLLDLKKYKVVDPSQEVGRINVPIHRYNPENVYIRRTPQGYGLSGDIFASEDLLSYYTDTDKRFTLYLSNEPGGIPNEYYLWVPYLDTNSGIFTPEIYLIAAECEARIGSVERALQLINTLRNHRIVNNKPVTAESKDEALIKVLAERRRELAFTGCLRLFDLKRLNKDPRFAKTITRTVEGETLTLPPNNLLYVLPIPPKVLLFNPDMKPNKR